MKEKITQILTQGQGDANILLAITRIEHHLGNAAQLVAFLPEEYKMLEVKITSALWELRNYHGRVEGEDV